MGRGNQKVNAASEEPSEEEDPSEEEFCVQEDDSDEEKEHYKIDANDELESPEEDPSENESHEGEPFEDEPDEQEAIDEVEEDTVEDPNEEQEEEEVEEDTVEDPDEEQEEGPYEEELSEEIEVQSSHESDNDETHQSKEAKSSSEKRRSEEGLDTLMQGKKPKLDYDAATPAAHKEQRTSTSNENVLKQEANTEGTGKKRQSRWDIGQHEVDGATVVAAKKRKTRWSDEDTELKLLGPLSLPDILNGKALETFNDPKAQKLIAQLHEVNQKLKEQGLVDATKISTKEAKAIAKLTERRQSIISELIKMNPTFQPPHHKPSKLYKKLYIPAKEYPDYNFVGLIIGPRGLTQKRMEKETGARILLRGKGSVKEDTIILDPKRKRDGDNEDLHVLIEAETQKSVDAAVKMVEKLLVPVEEAMNEHKRAQLRELAELNGTLKEKRSFTIERIFKTNEPCNVCGNANHLTSSCPLTASTPERRLNTHQVNFLAEVGNYGPSLFGKSPSPIPTSTRPANSAGIGSSEHNGKPSKEGFDESNLYVGFLPRSVDTDKLIELFQPFGPITEAKVMMDRASGLSRGYGFVQYVDPLFATAAIARMNGFQIEGKALAVRVAGKVPSTVSNNLGPAATPSATFLPASVYLPGPPGSMLPIANTSVSFSASGQYVVLPSMVGDRTAPVDWPGHSASMVPDSYISTRSNGFLLYSDPAGGSSAPYRAPGQHLTAPPPVLSGPITSAEELEQFPGYLRSFDDVNPRQSTSSDPFSSRVRFPQYSGRHQTYN